ncbi:3650_t:CDS:2 [Funneliformis geosporum]|uniref:3650_t:CDS:1 n=1 Tax=Funneliformis geosporum TaxID=1117311 RepID=A0A9W4SVE8_9GLOM|nr:3650_t:CDS:2 [Funneliformis geosporum]
MFPRIEPETDVSENKEDSETNNLNTSDHKAITSGSEKDEFRIVEAGKNWVDKQEMKFLKEAVLKLPKTLKDMLVKLMAKTR